MITKVLYLLTFFKSWYDPAVTQTASALPLPSLIRRPIKIVIKIVICKEFIECIETQSLVRTARSLPLHPVGWEN